jgi:hypothetical protein
MYFYQLNSCEDARIQFSPTCNNFLCDVLYVTEIVGCFVSADQITEGRQMLMRKFKLSTKFRLFQCYQSAHVRRFPSEHILKRYYNSHKTCH